MNPVSVELKANRRSEIQWRSSGSVLVVDCSPRQHHGVVVGPFGSVAPPLLVAVPEVAPGWITDNAVWETLPHREGKVHLEREQRPTQRGRKDMRPRSELRDTSFLVIEQTCENNDYMSIS